MILLKAQMGLEEKRRIVIAANERVKDYEHEFSCTKLQII